MAITKIGHQNTRMHLKRAIEYIMNPEKTEGGRWVGTHNCCQPYEDFIATKEYQSQRRGREDVKWGRQGYHIVISFSDKDQEKVTPEMAMQIVSEFTERYIPDYEAVYSVHTDTQHKHCHLIWNSVDMIEGKKYHYAPGDWARYIQPITNDICEKYGLETICIDGLATTVNLDYGTWQRKQEGLPTWEDYERYDIDMAVNEVRKQGGTYGDFLKILRSYGYFLRGHENTQTLSIRHPEQKRKNGTKTHQFGEDYVVEALKARIAGTYLKEQEIEPTEPTEPHEPMETEIESMPEQAIKTVPIKDCRFTSPVPDRRNPYTVRMRYMHCSVRLESIYALRVYRGRRACTGRYVFRIRPIGPRTWQDRKYSMELQALIGDLTFLRQNEVHSSEDVQKIKSQYKSNLSELKKVKAALKRKHNQLVEKRDTLIEKIKTKQGDIATLQELESIEQQLLQVGESISEKDIEIKEAGACLKTAQRVEKDFVAAEKAQEQKQEQKIERGRNGTAENRTEQTIGGAAVRT